MGLPGLPKINLDIAETVNTFLTLLRDMNDKLDVLIELQRGPDRCGACDQVGRLSCPSHGPVRVPSVECEHCIDGECQGAKGWCPR